MRWRVSVVFFLFVAYIAIGCREPLKPNIDRNQPPETWITAAPFDTITLKDKNGHPLGESKPGTIPIRFHMYWAGSDKDGVVSGFYWAVVETLPRIPEGGTSLPNLPGPKPQDYHYTSRTDSTFIFRVAEDIPDRQHAFFIYSVDNQGKPDPTPARFIFNAQDRFPPVPVFDDCHCVGTVYELQPGGGVTGVQTTVPLTHEDVRFEAAKDTCPSNSTLFFSWHGESPLPLAQITGYAYKLDEPNLIEVGPEMRSVTYFSNVGADTIPPTPGNKIFLLKAKDQAEGTARSTRRFEYNYSPDSWISGPDPASPSLLTTPRGERYALLTGGHLPPGGIVGSLLSSDSVTVMPALRGTFRTFFEIWKDTVFVRHEGDTVHLNSWVVLHSGGTDRDSKYNVQVSALGRGGPEFPPAPHPVLDQDGPNGSPVGFRSQILASLTPTNDESRTAITGVYPIFDPNDVFNAPVIGGYHAMTQAGRAFGFSFAVDGDGSQDRRIDNPRTLALRSEDGSATPYEQTLRPKVITFFVDRAPYFVTSDPLFRPRTDAVDTFTGQNWDLRLVGADEDWPPAPGQNPGGPGRTLRLRRRISVIGQHLNGDPYEYTDGVKYQDQQNINFTVPNDLQGGSVILRVELCDCDQCELELGSGRCRTIDIPVNYIRSTPDKPASAAATDRPGS